MTLVSLYTRETEQDVPQFVDEETYLRVYAEQHYEWINGELVKLPSSLPHVLLITFFIHCLDAYFEFRPIGRAFSQTFPVRMPSIQNWREPDVLVVLNDNTNIVSDQGVRGAPDICIEVVSPESVERDYADKVVEYEQGGVKEYWLIDYTRQQVRFHRLDASGRYQFVYPDANGYYLTPLLPDLKLPVATLWQTPLPGPVSIVRTVEAMLNPA